MAKKDEFETLDGGDAASDVLDFTYSPAKSKEQDAQERMTERHSKEGFSSEEKEPEEYRIKGGDSEWDVEQEGADLEESGEEVEEPEEEGEKEVEEGKEFEIELEETPEIGETLTIDGKDYVVEGVEPEDETSEADKKIADDMIKYLAETGDTKYIIKGKEYDLRDLTPQEIKQRFSLAGRGFQIMQELAEQRKELERREVLARDGAERTQQIMSRYGEATARKEPELPAALQIDRENDTEEVVALKQMNTELHNRVSTLEKGYTETKSMSDQREYYRQLDTLEKEFPVLSKEEVSAVMAYYPDADIRVVAENSHLNRISDEYFGKVLQHRPDIVRQIKEEGIKEYLSKKPKSGAVARKRASSTVSSKASSAKKRTPQTFDEIEAHYDDMRKGYLESLTEE